MDDFRDRVAIVTGGGSGIGAGIAITLARAGTHIVLADRREDRIGEIADGIRAQFGVRVIGVVADVADAASVDALADTAYAEFGAVHLLFNNVGTSSIGPSWETSLEDWHRVIQTNLFGCIHGIRAFVPRMIAGGEPGHVTNTSSMAGLVPVGLKAPYTASKFGIVGLSQALEEELRSLQVPIGVSVVCPGPVSTPMVQDSIDDLSTRDITDDERNLLFMLRDLCANGITGEDAGRMVVDAIRSGRFWVLPNAELFMDGVHDAHARLIREAVVPAIAQ